MRVSKTWNCVASMQSKSPEKMHTVRHFSAAVVATCFAAADERSLPPLPSRKFFPLRKIIMNED